MTRGVESVGMAAKQQDLNVSLNSQFCLFPAEPLNLKSQLSNLKSILLMQALGDGSPAEDFQVWPGIQKALSLPIKALSYQAKRAAPKAQDGSPQGGG